MGLSNFTSGITEQRGNFKGFALPDCFAEPHWYAAYTRAQHEKSVAAELGMREVEHFLPLYSCVRRWKDRRVQLELPLFPGYVFVRLALRVRAWCDWSALAGNRRRFQTPKWKSCGPACRRVRARSRIRS